MTSSSAAAASASSSWEKPTALIIALVAAAMLSIRVYVAADRLGSWSAGVHFLSHFFTILTNNRVMMIMWYTSRCKKPEEQPSTSLLLSNVTSIIIVGLVYHVVLAHLIQLPPGILPILADHGTHTLVPILTLLWWLIYERRTVPWSAVLYTIPWPLVYSIYILFRAIVLKGNFYPYPFLDLNQLGWPMLITNIVGLGVVFMVFASIFVGINHLLWKDTMLSSSSKVSPSDKDTKRD